MERWANLAWFVIPKFPDWLFYSCSLSKKELRDGEKPRMMHLRLERNIRSVEESIFNRKQRRGKYYLLSVCQLWILASQCKLIVFITLYKTSWEYPIPFYRLRDWGSENLSILFNVSLICRKLEEITSVPYLLR